ncbi:hypothetical protein AVEN_73864-1 [Araneus ventricosus]|uniref:Uncharacterized protein n=1 Tax=Araneus ventricosus TaxID=182803 RepID=A0A4Y2J696_ARAVE|nr:hypothetical protein AVEN_73864-1 [Araneus ventricosus]
MAEQKTQKSKMIQLVMKGENSPLYLMSASRIGSTDHEYDGGESTQSNRPSPCHLESDDLSEVALTYKAYFDKFYPSSIKAHFGPCTHPSRLGLCEFSNSPSCVKS